MSGPRGAGDYFAGSLPQALNLPPDVMPPAFPGALGAYRVLPPGAAGVPGINAAAQSALAPAIDSLQSQINNLPVAKPGVGDDITHGNPIWWLDPGFNWLRDDFTQIQSASSTSVPVAAIGQLGWVLDASSAPSHGGLFGGIPPFLGQYWWDNNANANAYGVLHLGQNGVNGGNTGSNIGWAMFDNPGSWLVFIFRVGGSSPGFTNGLNFGQKSIYVGLAGSTTLTNFSTNASARPDTFFGVRYDTAPAAASTSVSYACTAVTQTGSNMVITGTFTGANSATGTTWVGRWFNTTSFGNAANNGTFLCTAATTTSLTLLNPNGITATGQSAHAIANTPLVLTAAANGNGVQVVYTGTITGGGTNNYVGQFFYVSGFGNAGNNGGPFKCVANSTTTITLANPLVTGSAETHAGYTSGPNLLDTTFVLEAVQNPSYGAVGRNNTQGQTLNTGIAPIVGTWHRLDVIINAAGSITLILDGSAANTLTATVSKQTITTGAAQFTGSVSGNQLSFSWTASPGSIAQAPWVTGSQVTVSGFSGTQAPFNATWSVMANGSGNLYFDYAAASSVGSASVTGTISGYPAVFPCFIYGNTQEASPQASSLTFWADMWAMAWNPNLGPATPGTAAAAKPRYF
jgi:hypothetical protein